MSSPINPVTAEEMIPNDPALLDEIIRQAEARLQAQLQAALASDNRAMVLASLQGAASAALAVGIAHGDLTGLASNAATYAAMALFIGAVCAGVSARPVPFGFVGSNPIDWVEAIRTNEPTLRARAYYASYLDDYLRRNERSMTASGKWTVGSLVSLVTAPFLAGLILALQNFPRGT